MQKIIICGIALLALPVVANAQHAGAALPAVMPAMRAAPPAAAAPIAPIHGFAHPVAAPPSAPAARVGTRVGAHNAAAPMVPPPAVVPPSQPLPLPPPLPPVSPVIWPPIYPNAGGWFIPFGQEIPNAPGFGFDYEHYFAVYPAARFTPITSGLYVPFLGGGYYMPYPTYPEAAPPPEQAVTQAAPEYQYAAASQAAPPQEAPAQASGPTVFSKAEKLPEFIFVRKDGTVFFAVAYSFTKINLRYITQDGLPKSVPLSGLDMKATREFNEERGIVLRLPS